MSGTNPVARFDPTNFTTQDPTTYKTDIDANFTVAQRSIDNFAPRQRNTPAMKVTLDAGHIFDGTTLTEVASQDTGTITAPSTHPRIDRVVVDSLTGAVSVITGVESASPTAPAITSGKSPVARVLLQTSSTSITNSMITDERDLSQLGGTQSGASAQSTPADPTGTTDTTGKMMGLAASITPQRTGKVLIIISGSFTQSVGGDGAKWQIRYGTGSAPSNAAALAGTTAGALEQVIAANNGPKYAMPSLNAVVTGLTLGTAYWVDVGLAAITGGTASLFNISISVIEL